MNCQNRETCRFCKKTTVSDNELCLIGDITRQMLDVLFLKLNFDTDNPILICTECATKLQDAVAFKAHCLSSERKIIPFRNSKENAELVSAMPDDKLICHFCTMLTESGCYTYLDNNKEYTSLADMVKKHIPELDYAANELIICKSCLASLQDLCNFIRDCLDTGEDIPNFSSEYQVICHDIDIDEMEKEDEPVEDIVKNEIDINEEPVERDNLELPMENKEPIVKLVQMDWKRKCLNTDEENEMGIADRTNMESQLKLRDIQNFSLKYQVGCHSIDINEKENKEKEDTTIINEPEMERDENLESTEMENEEKEDTTIINEPEMEIDGNLDSTERDNIKLLMKKKELVVKLTQMDGKRNRLDTDEENEMGMADRTHMESRLKLRDIQNFSLKDQVACHSIDMNENEEKEDTTIISETETEIDGNLDSTERHNIKLLMKQKELSVKLTQMDAKRKCLDTDEENEMGMADRTNMENRLKSRDIQNCSLKDQVACQSIDINEMENEYEEKEDTTIINEPETERDGNLNSTERDNIKLFMKKKELVVKLTQTDWKRNRLDTDEENEMDVADQTNVESRLKLRDIQNFSLEYQVACHGIDINDMENECGEKEDTTIQNEPEMEIDGNLDSTEGDNNIKLLIRKKKLVVKVTQMDWRRFDNGAVLPQPEKTSRLCNGRRCSSNLEGNLSSIKHTSANKNASKVVMHQSENFSNNVKNEQNYKKHDVWQMEASGIPIHRCSSCSFQTRNEHRLKGHLLKHENTSKITMYKCDSCSFQTKHSSYLKTHLLQHKDPSEVIIHKCGSCSFQTKHKNSLRNHLLTHKDSSKVTVYRCSWCSYQTIYKRNLKSHALVHKDSCEVTIYKCDSCSFQTRYRSRFKHHLLVHKDPSEVTVYRCNWCSYQTKYKNNLKVHILVHKDSSEVTIYKCDSCFFQTKYKDNLKSHILVHKNPSEVTIYKCDSCSYQTRYKKYLKYHLQKHKNKNPSEVMYKCNDCSFQSRHKNRLKSHILLHKTSGTPSEVTMHKCDSCSFQTKCEYELEKHTLIHESPSEATMYKCGSCSFQTKYKRNLRRHLLTHRCSSEVTVYRCNSCSYQTKYKRYLKSHVLVHQDSSEVTEYRCNWCSYQTRRKSHLKGHLLVHKDSSQVTMYKCDSCSFQTKYSNSLKAHLLQHKDPSEVTIYKCDSCSFQTRYRRYLKRHLLVHKDASEVTKYKCDFCSYQTIYNKDFNSHLRRKHKNKNPSEVMSYKCYYCSFQSRHKNRLKSHILLHKTPRTPS